MEQPNFEKLRAERDAAIDAFAGKMRADGWEVGQCALRDKSACYCDCINGGPCEHDTDGVPYESDDGLTWSATCSRCGMTAMSHSLRLAF